MITGTDDRRRGALFWSPIFIVSTALSVALFSLLALYFVFRYDMTPRGESLMIPESITVTKRLPVPPKPQPKRPVIHQRAAPPAAAPAPRHELAKEVLSAPAQPPERPHAVATPSLVRDNENFANEVAQLNKQNDPHAIPTIDPASQGVSTKSYRLDTSRSTSGEDHGNGVITPIKSWQDRGMDCYYARYVFTYPNGSTEDGNIPWPVCYNPASDPFHEPPHPMDFPLPIAGYTLPPGTQLPPIEKQVYDQWAAENVH